MPNPVSLRSTLLEPPTPWLASAPSISAPLMPRRLRPRSSPAYQPAFGSALCAAASPLESVRTNAAMAFLFMMFPLVSGEGASFAAARVKHGQPRVKLSEEKKWHATKRGGGVPKVRQGEEDAD